MALRVDLVNPPNAARVDLFNAPYASVYPAYQLLNWGAGIKLTDTVAIGVAWQHSYSESRQFHAMDAWALGYVARWWDGLGVGKP